MGKEWEMGQDLSGADHMSIQLQRSLFTSVRISILAAARNRIVSYRIVPPSVSTARQAQFTPSSRVGVPIKRAKGF